MQPQVMQSATRFITHPTLTMSAEFILAASKAMALGAVDTGNMKVKEQAIVAGMISSSGLTHRDAASWIMMGRNMLADATLAATWVSSEAPSVVMITMLQVGKLDKAANC